MSPHPPTASTSKLPPTRLTIKLPADRRKVTSSNSEALETAFLSTPVPALPSETTATEKSKGKKRARVEFAPVDAGLVPEVSDFGRTQGFDQLSSDELVAFRRMGPEELRARVELGKRTAEMEQLVEEAKKSRGGQLLEMMINEGAPAVANLAEQIGNTILKNEALERGELPEKVRESFSTTSEGLDSLPESLQSNKMHGKFYLGMNPDDTPTTMRRQNFLNPNSTTLLESLANISNVTSLTFQSVPALTVSSYPTFIGTLIPAIKKGAFRVLIINSDILRDNRVVELINETLAWKEQENWSGELLIIPHMVDLKKTVYFHSKDFEGFTTKDMTYTRYSTSGNATQAGLGFNSALDSNGISSSETGHFHQYPIQFGDDGIKSGPGMDEIQELCEISIEAENVPVSGAAAQKAPPVSSVQELVGAEAWAQSLTSFAPASNLSPSLPSASTSSTHVKPVISSALAFGQILVDRVSAQRAKLPRVSNSRGSEDLSTRAVAAVDIAVDSMNIDSISTVSDGSSVIPTPMADMGTGVWLKGQHPSRSSSTARRTNASGSRATSSSQSSVVASTSTTPTISYESGIVTCPICRRKFRGSRITDNFDSCMVHIGSHTGGALEILKLTEFRSLMIYRAGRFDMPIEIKDDRAVEAFYFKCPNCDWLPRSPLAHLSDVHRIFIQHRVQCPPSSSLRYPTLAEYKAVERFKDKNLVLPLLPEDWDPDGRSRSAVAQSKLRAGVEDRSEI